jgi:guanylate kinase
MRKERKFSGQKRIILAGKGASGKDYLRGMIQSRGFKYSVSHTTRPPRNSEVDGEDYYFVDLNDAKKMILSDSFIEHTLFNGWIYGTSRDEFFRSELFILTPSGIAQLSKKDREESFIIYIDVDEETRRKRMSERKDADSTERRLEADEKDFRHFSDFDCIIRSSCFDESVLDSLNIFKKSKT